MNSRSGGVLSHRTDFGVLGREKCFQNGRAARALQFIRRLSLTAQIRITLGYLCDFFDFSGTSLEVSGELLA
jgi:hypothetical protein